MKRKIRCWTPRIAGAADHVMVVMSKDTKLTGQDSSPGGEYPSQWIQER